MGFNPGFKGLNKTHHTNDRLSDISVQKLKNERKILKSSVLKNRQMASE
jgi:hypothetical protein